MTSFPYVLYWIFSYTSTAFIFLSFCSTVIPLLNSAGLGRRLTQRVGDKHKRKLSETRSTLSHFFTKWRNTAGMSAMATHWEVKRTIAGDACTYRLKAAPSLLAGLFQTPVLHLQQLLLWKCTCLANLSISWNQWTFVPV